MSTHDLCVITDFRQQTRFLGVTDLVNLDGVNAGGHLGDFSLLTHQAIQATPKDKKTSFDGIISHGDARSSKGSKWFESWGCWSFVLQDGEVMRNVGILYVFLAKRLGPPERNITWFGDACGVLMLADASQIYVGLLKVIMRSSCSSSDFTSMLGQDMREIIFAVVLIPNIGQKQSFTNRATTKGLRYQRVPRSSPGCFFLRHCNQTFFFWVFYGFSLGMVVGCWSQSFGGLSNFQVKGLASWKNISGRLWSSFWKGLRRRHIFSQWSLYR